MANLHRIRESIVLAYFSNIIDDDEFVLLYDANRPKNPDFNYKDHDQFDLDDYNDSECKANFRFEKDDIHRLKHVLQIPERIHCKNGTRVCGLDALCMMLARFAYPCRYGDLISMFGLSVPELCLVNLHMMGLVYDQFGHLLQTMDQEWLSRDCLTNYANAVHAQGAALQNCWGFVDGTVRPIARPSRNQRVMFNGHKRIHALKYQSVIAANGLIANLFGPIEGRRHDCYMLRESGLLQQLELHSYDPQGNVLCVYGDPAYPIRAHLQCPFKGGNLTLDQEDYNRSMSSVRVSVKWVFGDIINTFKYIDFKKNQQMLLSSCGKMYLVSGLLTNAHSCLYGNKTAQYPVLWT